MNDSAACARTDMRIIVLRRVSVRPWLLCGVLVGLALGAMTIGCTPASSCRDALLVPSTWNAPEMSCPHHQHELVLDGEHMYRCVCRRPTVTL